MHRDHRRRSLLLLVGIGVLIEVGLLAMAALGDLRETLPALLAIWSGIFILMLFGCTVARHGTPCSIESRHEGETPGRRAWALPVTILIFAALFRITLLPVWPTLSDDIYRYLWDGRVVVSGINPYAHVPSDAALAPLRDQSLYPNLNSPDYYSVYPPVSQAMFAAATAAADRRYDSSVTAAMVVLKAMLITLDLAAIALLMLLLASIRPGRGDPMRYAILYAWNPLPIVEIAGEAHAEAPMVFGIMLTIWAISRWRGGVRAAPPAAEVANGAGGESESGDGIGFGEAQSERGAGRAVYPIVACIGVVMAALTKAFPIVLAPFVLRAIGWRWALLLLGLLAIGAWPLLSPTNIANYFDSVQLYYRLFEFNAGPYLALKEIGRWWTGDDVSKTLGPALGVTYGLLVGAVFVWWKPHAARFDRDIVRAVMWLFGGYIVLATTVHPWYLLWILGPAVLCIPNNRAWLWLSFAVGWSYMAYGADPVRVPAWVTVATWVGFGLLLLVDGRPWLIDRVMQWRAAWKVRRLRPFIRGRTVLDVGAGDGWVARRLADVTACDITLLDVVDYNRTDRPLVIYDGNTMPFDDASFDTVLALTALHHCDRPDRVLDECVRVCRRRLIVTESVYRTAIGRRVLARLDRFFNRLRSGGSMRGPLHFRTADAWRSAFAERGLHCTETVWLSRGLHQHVLFVLDRNGTMDNEFESRDRGRSPQRTFVASLVHWTGKLESWLSEPETPDDRTAF